MTAEEIRATARLGAMALTGGTALVRGMHLAIARRALSGPAFGLLGPVAAPVREGALASTRAVYGLVEAGLRLAGTATGAALAARGDGEAAMTPRHRAALAVVNGAFGDLVEREVAVLAPAMAVRRDGRDVPLRPAALREAFPRAGGRVAVFVHGLVESDESWTYRSQRHHGRPGVSYAALLEADLGYTPVLLRYNTGLRISENGRRLDALLTALVGGWPVPVTELVLVGHSMGGLVVRSALAQAGDRSAGDGDGPAPDGAGWPGVVRATVTLGTPHLGAPLEKAAAVLTQVLAVRAETLPLAHALARRSVGIKDLRHGNLLDADWAGHPPESLRNPRVPVQLHPGSRHFTVHAVVWPRAGSWSGRTPGGSTMPGGSTSPAGPLASAAGELVGDLLVRPVSAAGTGGGRLGLPLPAEHVHRVPGLAHLDLLNHPHVYQRLRSWLADGLGAGRGDDRTTTTHAAD